MSNDWVLLFMLAAGLGGIVFVMRRFAGTPPQNNHAIEQLEEKLERVSRDMRFEISENLRGNRQEMSQSMAQFQQTLTEQLALMQTNLNAQLQTLGEGNTRRMAEVRETLDRQLQNLQETNIAKLEEMRKTVDEKLQTTLEKRLSESFKQVAERLEQVHQGLGQMQTLAQGVGDLQKVLSNVKTRGIFGEVQLQALLDQVLTIEQYGKQVETKPSSNQRVDFAIKLPGRS
ncbi:MAG: DNA recombination protein RmuC, partial [Burkholderiales bacterium]|nr:DNA recombination protein RmuC [Burkholderiales bacterium]